MVDSTNCEIEPRTRPGKYIYRALKVSLWKHLIKGILSSHCIHVKEKQLLVQRIFGKDFHEEESSTFSIKNLRIKFQGRS